MIAVTASSKMTNHHSMTSVTAKSAVTAMIREMIYTYIARPGAVTGPLLGDLQMLPLTGGFTVPMRMSGHGQVHMGPSKVNCGPE